MMREGRWRNDVDPAAAAGRWPGADRRRGDQLVDDAQPVDLEREHIEPDPAPPASTAATAYRYSDLVDDDRARVAALVSRLKLELAHVSDTFHVGRTRRGYVVLFTEHERDERGRTVIVLGSPVLRHHILPVGADELPAACRRAGADR